MTEHEQKGFTVYTHKYYTYISIIYCVPCVTCVFARFNIIQSLSVLDSLVGLHAVYMNKIEKHASSPQAHKHQTINLSTPDNIVG